jgi:hypothetical protein
VPPRSNLVNLDAMITRADFAAEESEQTHVETVASISVRDFTRGALIGPSLRKPDFQRETNHWSPEQITSFLECYVTGELIPSVILWKSPAYLFVIDGGHRLSVLRAWIEDDYGDGPLSRAFFGYDIPRDQTSLADKTRRLVHSRVGPWRHYETRQESPDLSAEERRKITAVVSRALPIQWVTGNADKAEASFFRINTKGTPLDEIEELLLRSRKKPIAIAARAVIRAGKGHRYWSSFPRPAAETIEAQAAELHDVLFEPELQTPIKTLDLPLGGSRGIRTALEVLIQFMLIASRNNLGHPATVEEQQEDSDGSATVEGLSRALRLARWITGNDGGSLGLHPAVYFYGPTGRHSGPMFMGTVALIGERIASNDGGFFARFTEVRAPLEHVLVQHKDLIATILQKHFSHKRAGWYKTFLAEAIRQISAGEEPDEAWILQKSDLRGKLLTGAASVAATRFSEETKSAAFIALALDSALKCPICNGYLDPAKSVSYDHITRRRDGGTGELDNVQLVHPYCNQSMRQ